MIYHLKLPIVALVITLSAGLAWGESPTKDSHDAGSAEGTPFLLPPPSDNASAGDAIYLPHSDTPAQIAPAGIQHLTVSEARAE